MTKQGERRDGALSRREFLVSSAAAASAATLSTLHAATPRGARPEPLRIGLIGCGGRGTGAAVQALQADGAVQLVAMADMFADRLASSLEGLRGKPELQERIVVDEAHRFVGFDAYEKVLATDIDVVLLTTPPHFRPVHFAAAIAAGKHVFMEKPVAVDGAGIRAILAAAETAKQKGLAVVSGLQRHHQNGYIEAMRRVHDGAIGDIVAAHCYWNQGGLWVRKREPEWSDMEWQLRNWLYFTWLSGDHIVEQHVHNLDVVNWAKRAHPVRALGLGGRQTRVDPAYGHIFDHHSVHYEYGDGTWLFSQCRQMVGCKGRVSEHLIGTKGRCDTDSRRWSISGDTEWKYEGDKNNPYQTEHDDLFASIRKGQPLNEGRYVAESTLTAIMGRMATYSGKEITWGRGPRF
ncbi:MAG: Gfo/Idh/MocA family oxidoreductase [Planctomycetota bacterium]